MKRFHILLIVVLACSASLSGKTSSRDIHAIEMTLDNGFSVIVDERFELVSIAFRLAGAEEYSNGHSPDYLRQVDSCFASYKNHQLFAFIREVRESYNFAYDTAAKSAFMIELKGSHVTISPEWDLEKEFSGEDERCWNEAIFRRFVTLLDSFYRLSRFHSFFISHSAFYEKAVQSCSDVPQKIKAEWFQDFYGEPLIGVDLVLGLCIGPNNYSVSDARRKKNWNGRKTIIIGTMEESKGIPFFYDDKNHILVHEMAHYYTNPLVEPYCVEMADAMNFIFSEVKEEMARIGYGNAEDVTVEWINELFANCYLERETSGGCIRNVARNVENGYYWMKRAVDFMDNFYADRESFPTIAEFMPQLVEFTKELPAKWAVIQKEFDNRRPYVVEVFPAGNEFEVKTKEIRISFSSPMEVGIYGIFTIPEAEPLPGPVSCGWENDHTFVINFDNTAMTPGATYGFRLPSYTFSSTRYYTMEKDFDFVFKVID